MTSRDHGPVPLDPGLTSLHEMFTVGGAVALAAAELVSGEGPGDLRYVRYRPGRDCITAWEFADGFGGTRLVSARLYRDGSDRRAVGDPRFQRLAKAVADDGPRPFRHLVDPGILLQAVPLDRRLPGLVSATAPDWVCRVLAERSLVDGSEPVGIEVLAGSYKPFIRSVLRYSAADGRTICFAKVVRRGSGVQPVEQVREVAAGLRSMGAPLSVAEPIDYLPEADLLLVAPAPGPTTLADQVDVAVGEPDAAGPLITAMAVAAEGLQCLQRLELGSPPAGVTPTDLLLDLRRKTERLRAVATTACAELDRALGVLEELAANLPPERVGLAHGAYRHEHLHLSDGGLTSVDLDNLRLSGVNADAGSFLAFLDLVVLDDPRRAAVIGPARGAFVEAFSANPAYDPDWLAWYRAEGHIKWALRRFFSLAPDWPATVDALVGRVREGVGSC